jgi:hypothetical protein
LKGLRSQELPENDSQPHHALSLRFEAFLSSHIIVQYRTSQFLLNC